MCTFLRTNITYKSILNGIESAVFSHCHRQEITTEKSEMEHFKFFNHLAGFSTERFGEQKFAETLFSFLLFDCRTEMMCWLASRSHNRNCTIAHEIVCLEDTVFHIILFCFVVGLVFALHILLPRMSSQSDLTHNLNLNARLCKRNMWENEKKCAQCAQPKRLEVHRMQPQIVGFLSLSVPSNWWKHLP